MGEIIDTWPVLVHHSHLHEVITTLEFKAMDLISVGIG